MKKAFVVLALAVLGVSYAQTCEDGFRLITHDLGDTCIPENPQRVATDNLDTLGLMLTLGVQPAGHQHGAVDALVTTAPELEEIGAQFNANSVEVGSPMNIEAVLMANPDLILIENSAAIEQLKAIAPVVAYDVYANIVESREMNWYDPMMFWANVLGVTEEAEVQRNLVEQRLDTLAEYTEDVTVSIIFVGSDGLLRAGSPMWIYEQLARRAGLTRPEAQGLTLDEHEQLHGTPFWGSFSLEQLDMADADVLLLTTPRGGNEEELEASIAELEANPLWGTLNAVQENAVYQVNYSQWISFDFSSINHTIDDMFRLVAGVDPQEVSPNPFLMEEPSSN